MSAGARRLAHLLAASGAARWSLRRIQNGVTPTLTILAYHRVAAPGAAGDPQVISAAPENFAWQMDYLQRNFTVLSFDTLMDCVRQSETLPANAVVITFDDGYRDNLEVAAPILQQRGLPAIIFVTTGMIGTPARFWWDELHTLIQQAPPVTIQLPHVGRLALHTAPQRAAAGQRLRQVLKTLPEAERSAAMAAWRGALGGAPGAAGNTAAERLYLTWDEARRLAAMGLAVGAHTHTHPILTRLPLDQAEAEIATSKRILEAEIGRPVRFFAYPNGGPGDFNQPIKNLLARQGFQAAVTLVRGGNRLRGELDWLALRRIYIGAGDNRDTFIVKTSGLLDALSRYSLPRTQAAY